MIVRRRKLPLALTADHPTCLLEVCPYVLKLTWLPINDLFWSAPDHLPGEFSTVPYLLRVCFPVVIHPKNIIENP